MIFAWRGVVLFHCPLSGVEVEANTRASDTRAGIPSGAEGPWCSTWVKSGVSGKSRFELHRENASPARLRIAGSARIHSTAYLLRRGEAVTSLRMTIWVELEMAPNGFPTQAKTGIGGHPPRRRDPERHSCLKRNVLVVDFVRLRVGWFCSRNDIFRSLVELVEGNDIWTSQVPTQQFKSILLVEIVESFGISNH